MMAQGGEAAFIVVFFGALMMAMTGEDPFATAKQRESGQGQQRAEAAGQEAEAAGQEASATQEERDAAASREAGRREFSEFEQDRMNGQDPEAASRIQEPASPAPSATLASAGQNSLHAAASNPEAIEAVAQLRNSIEGDMVQADGKEVTPQQIAALQSSSSLSIA
jgi:hypothetical protein